MRLPQWKVFACPFRGFAMQQLCQLLVHMKLGCLPSQFLLPSNTAQGFSWVLMGNGETPLCWAMHLAPDQRCLANTNWETLALHQTFFSFSFLCFLLSFPLSVGLHTASGSCVCNGSLIFLDSLGCFPSHSNETYLAPSNQNYSVLLRQSIGDRLQEPSSSPSSLRWASFYFPSFFHLQKKG